LLLTQSEVYGYNIKDYDIQHTPIGENRCSALIAVKLYQEDKKNIVREIVKIMTTIRIISPILHSKKEGEIESSS